MAKSLQRVNDVDQEPAILPRESSSSPTELYGEDFALAWDNDVKLHISSQVLHLRRCRRLSQAEVAREMGTSQPAIARIEAGEENITLDTLQRLIAALGGRFSVSIQPRELPVYRMANWWEPAVTHTGGWGLRFVAVHQTGDTERAVIGIERTAFSGALVLATNATT